MKQVLLWALVVVSVVITTYVLFGREQLKKIECRQKEDPSGPQWAVRWFAFWEPWEILLWRKSRTLLFARFKMFIGTLLTFLTQTQSIDLTPMTMFVSEKWRPYVQFAIDTTPMAITVLGLMDEKLRWGTTEPVEMKAVREEDVPDHVRAAIIEADRARNAAVAKIKVAKADGEVQA